MLGVHRPQALGERRQGLAGAQEQIAAGAQRVLQRTQGVLLRHRLEVDQRIAADHQVHLGEGRIGQEVVPRQHHALAQFVLDHERTAFADEEALQPLGGEFHRGRLRVGTRAGGLDALGVHVGGEDLQAGPAALALERLQEQHPDAVGLLPGGCPRRPHPDAVARLFAGHDVRDHHPLQGVEGIGVPEEARDGDEHLSAQRHRLGPVVRDEGAVVLHAANVAHLHPALDPPHDRRRFVVLEVNAADLQQQPKDLVQRLLLRHRTTIDQGWEFDFLGERLVADVRDDAAGQFLGGHDRIHHTGADDAAGHAVELRRVRILGEEEAARGVDRHRPASAIGASAGQHDADHLIAIRFGQRGEEDVDRQGEAMRVLRCQVQVAGSGVHDRPGWDQVHAVGLDGHVVLDHDHRHIGVPRQQVAHHGLVIRRQVLDDHEGGPRVGGAGLEEALQGVQPAGRGTYGNHMTGEGSVRWQRPLRTAGLLHNRPLGVSSLPQFNAFRRRRPAAFTVHRHAALLPW